MSDQDAATFVAPPPNSAEMVTLLHSAIEQLMSQLPFDFSCGDFMGACMYHIVDSGRVGTPDIAELRTDVMAAFDRVAAEVQAGGGRKH